MKRPFPHTAPFSKKYRRLMDVVEPSDILGIAINADPDSMASALALRRLFWRKTRAVKVFRVNTVKRADNLAFIRLLRFDQGHIRHSRSLNITKWALLDSQPSHHPAFDGRAYDIIIDHHPIGAPMEAAFLDIQEHFGANASIMTEYIKAAGIKPSARLATALFYGIKTDTHNFVRASVRHDMNAFRYLYQFTDFNILKKIETSQMTRSLLSNYRKAMERLVFIKDIAFVYMDRVGNPDILVLIADFFMQIAEIKWSIVAGVHQNTLVVIYRNASFKGDAGGLARRMFHQYGGRAGGHRSAARAEIPVASITGEGQHLSDVEKTLKQLLKALR